MLYCRCCHSIFDESEVSKRREYHEYWGRPTFEEYGQCPECGSEKIDEADKLPKCDSCGEHCIGKTVWTNDDRHYCENCYEIQK